ncbi:hypothetical protein JG30_11210 [Bombilactobacillus mellifer]|uniref:Uncharacterized protein n=1 Tax=Bombilactobacillus mellifer TaxID=1218492 RepID=A0A0F4LRJ0_9LACO|nr:oligosaccharide flippase family protein [Bombilactobacillus mellifer]KJY60933.1 hypothetical protein JG30_11210 [Bombilactobacillus mellifer]
MTKKLFHNYIYVLGYQIFLMILPVITLPYITRVLLPHGVGINSWVNAFSSYFSLFAVLGLTTYGQREIAVCNQKKEKIIRAFWEIEIASVITTLVSLFFYFIAILFIGKYKIYLLIYSVTILAAMFDISWFFAGLERFSILTLRNFIVKTASILLIFIFVRNPNDLWKYIVIQSMATLMSNISLWPVALKILEFPVKIQAVNIIFRIKNSFFYFLPQIAISLYVTLNKVILGYISGPIETGFFDSSDKIVRLIFSIFTAASSVMLPRISSLYSRKKIDFIMAIEQGILLISIWIVLPIIFGIIVNAKLIVLVLLGKKYLLMISVLCLSAFILLPMSIANILGNQLLVPMNRIKSYTISVFIGAIINLLISYPLISILNAKGAAIASIISESVVAISQFFFCKDLLKISNYCANIMIILSIAICLFLTFLMLIKFWQISLSLKLVLSIVVVALYFIATIKLPVAIIKKIKQ